MGSSSKKVTVGYKIYLGVHFILCRGPVDYVKRVRVDEKDIYSGEASEGQIDVDLPNLFGGKKQEGGIVGAFDMEFGLPTQAKNDYLLSKIGTQISAYRGVVGAVLRQMYLGTQPYIKKWDFRLQRIHVRQDNVAQWYDDKSEIPTTDVIVAPVKSLWEYQITTIQTSAPAIPSSGWNSPSYSPFGSNSPSFPFVEPHPIETSWSADTGIWLKKTVVCSGRNDIVISGHIENALYLFWDTVSAGDYNAGNADIGSIPFWSITIPKSLATAGSHTIHIYATDDTVNHVNTYIYAEVVESPDNDMNPSHIIRECLTDPDWGLGYPDDDIDDDEFRRAADTLYSERFGLSFIWDKQKPVEEFISDILEHIDATLYVSRSTGKFVLKLIRQDYNETGLTILDEDSISSVTSFSKTSFGEFVNSVSVVYYDRQSSKQDSVTAQDIALYQQQGDLVETTIQYPGITSKILASRVAERELHALSSSLISCTVNADRTAANINIGGAFILDWPEYDINSVIMRCQEISFGDGLSNTVTINCVQDVFATQQSAYHGDISEVPPSLIASAQAASPRLLIEAPYYYLVRNNGEADTNDIITNNNYAGYLLQSAVRPGTSHLNAELWVDDGGGTYEDEGGLDFSPCGVPSLDAPFYTLDKTTTSIVLDNVFDLDLVTTPTYCQMGDEIMRVDSIAQNSAGQWEMTVGRGCLDTTPQEHTVDSSGQYVFFYEDLNGASTKEFNSGETVSSKVLTNTLSSQLSLASAPVDSIYFRNRAFRPYPPGQYKINSAYYPSFVTADSGDNVLVEWAWRDRLQQTSATIYDHTEGDIGPEAGVTATVRLYDEVDVLVSEQSGISNTFAGVDLSPLTTNSARIDVTFVRGGVESWMPASHRFEWNYFDSGFVDSASDTEFALDTFTGTENTSLSTYNPAWTRHISYSSDCEIASGRVRASTSGVSAYYHSGTPASANYTVSATLYFHEDNGDVAHVGVCGRMSTSANTFYMARYEGFTSDAWQLYKAVSGTFTLLGSYAETMPAGSSANVKLEMIGSAIKLYVDEVERVSVTDSAITAAGKSGIRSGSTHGDTKGIHIDNFIGKN